MVLLWFIFVLEWIFVSSLSHHPDCHDESPATFPERELFPRPAEWGAMGHRSTWLRSGIECSEEENKSPCWASSSRGNYTTCGKFCTLKSAACEARMAGYFKLVPRPTHPAFPCRQYPVQRAQHWRRFPTWSIILPFKFFTYYYSRSWVN